MARSQPAAAAAAGRRTGHPAALETQLLRDRRTRPAARAAGTAHSAVSVTDQNGWNGVTATGAQCMVIRYHYSYSCIASKSSRCTLRFAQSCCCCRFIAKIRRCEMDDRLSSSGIYDTLSLSHMHFKTIRSIIFRVDATSLQDNPDSTRLQSTNVAMSSAPRVNGQCPLAQHPLLSQPHCWTTEHQSTSVSGVIERLRADRPAPRRHRNSGRWTLMASSNGSPVSGNLPVTVNAKRLRERRHDPHIPLSGSGRYRVFAIAASISLICGDLQCLLHFGCIETIRERALYGRW